MHWGGALVAALGVGLSSCIEGGALVAGLGCGFGS